MRAHHRALPEFQMRKFFRLVVTTLTCLGGVLSWWGSTIVMLTSLICSSALAHHSAAGFDVSKEMILSGVVRQLQWTNPHSYLQLLVADDAGGTVEWSVEVSPPNLAARAGWTKDTLKAGDKVMLVVHPMKTGGHRGELVSATLPDGRVLMMRPPGLPPPPPQ
jgi:hypothetical protein